MSRMYKCSVFGCKQEKGYSLHFIPEKNRAKWLRFLSGVEVTSNTRVCSRHFTPDSFENWSQYSSGFATRLKLKSTAFPTLSGTGVDDRRSILQLPSTVRHVGCQTDPPRRVSAGTQLANGTMKRSVRSSGVLAVPRTREAAVGTDRPVSRLFRELTSDPAPPVAPPPAPAHDEPGPPLPQMMIVPDVCLLNQDEQAPIEIEVELTTSITNTPSSSSQQNSQWTSQDSQNRPSVSDQEKKSWSRYGSLSKDLVRELCSSTVGTAPVSAAFRPTAQENASPSHKSVWFAAATESGPHNQLTYYERRCEVEVLSSEDEANADDEDADALSDIEEDGEPDPDDSDYFPNSESGESSEENDLNEEELSSSHKPFQTSCRPLVWCLHCQALAGILCTDKCHQTVYGCPECVSGNAADVVCLENLTVHFNSRTDFHKHAITEHGAAGQVAEHRTCEDCGKSNRVEDEDVCECRIKPRKLGPKRFLTEIGQKVHYRRLHGDYRHTCKYCLMDFEVRQTKLQHERLHNKRGLPYSCPSCQKRFRKFHERNAHLKIHGEQKSYLCSTCDTSFNNLWKYEQHVRTHSGEKHYTCQVCERSFTHAGHLKSHMRLHTGEKPFVCEQCGECFNHSVSLKNHLLRQHVMDPAGESTEVGGRIDRPFSDSPPKKKPKEGSERSPKQRSAPPVDKEEVWGYADCWEENRDSDSGEEWREERGHQKRRVTRTNTRRKRGKDVEKSCLMDVPQ